MPAYHALSSGRRQAPRFTRAVLAVLLAIAVPPASGAEVGGVTLPEQIELDGATLLLNGAGIRTKFFVNIYAGALYLPRRADSPEVILAMQGPRRVRMEILYKEIEAAKLREGWSEGFESNQGEAVLAGLAARLERFNALFPTVRRGQRIDFDFHPDGTTTVSLDGEPLGSIAGADFQRALLEVWLGRRPAHGGLKRAMLGRG